MKSRHVKRIPRFLDDDLRAKRLEAARQLLGVLQVQERCHLRDLITGDNIWVRLDTKPGTIWLSADAELPIRVKRTITGEKRKLIVFCGIHGITHCCWLAKDSILDSLFFCEVLSPLAQKMQPNSKATRKPLTLIHMDNTRVHTVRATQKKMDVSRFKHTPQPPHSPDIDGTPSHFSFSVG